ncbi:hypothetical protein P7C73_g1967, partial [Tremellales sp. Uapishka_1]
MLDPDTPLVPNRAIETVLGAFIAQKMTSDDWTEMAEWQSRNEYPRTSGPVEYISGSSISDILSGQTGQAEIRMKSFLLTALALLSSVQAVGFVARHDRKPRVHRRATTTTSIKPAASTSSGTPSWKATGCYVDTSTRVISGYMSSSSVMTTALCLSTCQGKNYTVAGLEDGKQCFCGSSLASSATASTGCTFACSGNASDTCGGNWRIAVYTYSSASSLAGSTIAASSSKSSPSAFASKSSSSSAKGSSSSSLTSSLKTSSTSTAPSSKVSSSASKAATTASTTLTASTSKSTSISKSTASSAAATASSVSPVGLAWNGDSGKDMTPFAGAGWYYGWSLTTNNGVTTDGKEFVPMVWGSGSVSSVASDEKTWPSGTKYILSFNEPDQSGQANLNASYAATLHQQWVKSLSGAYKIGAPAVSRGAKQWLVDWIAACAGKCQYDFIPFHFYGDTAADLNTYIDDFHTTFNKPLWITEFACNDYSSGNVCTAPEVENFMKVTIGHMRSSGSVDRWSWFGAFPNEASGGDPNGIMNSDSTPNAVGTYYLGL